MTFWHFVRIWNFKGFWWIEKKAECRQKMLFITFRMQIIPLDHKKLNFKDLMNYQMYQREGYSLLVELLILNNSFISYYSTLWNERRNAHHFLLLCIRGIGRFLLLFNKAHHQNNAPAYLSYYLNHHSPFRHFHFLEFPDNQADR